ncbi:MAG: acetolactate synthase small subunit [Deltaproteobacteria bacterium]|nr:acetolactate synthase small subunit [Deltaproteobacteria bacterium]MBW2305668.1 acetolactate synthase small subunit [Deltaproteobacteria bacterium]
MQHTISILVEDKPGVLMRISGLFARRGFNIESLTVGKTAQPGKSRFTIVVNGDDRVLEQVRKQLQKLIHVLKARNLKPGDAFHREYALLKVAASEGKMDRIIQVVAGLQGKIVEASDGMCTVEFTGNERTIDSAFNLLRPFGIHESIRTGKIAMLKGKATL